jgi:hypothetical protein
MSSCVRYDARKCAYGLFSLWFAGVAATETDVQMVVSAPEMAGSNLLRLVAFIRLSKL